MKYAIGFLLASVAVSGLLHGMESYREGRGRLNRPSHSYYFYYAVAALERRDVKRVELYCNLDPKLVAEIEQTIAQSVDQAKWSTDVIGDIKIRARL
jgi:hypothetical protein